MSAVVGFYLVMVIIAVVWLLVRQDPLMHLVSNGAPKPLWQQLTLGLGCGLFVVFISQWMDGRFEFARRLSDELCTLLPKLSDRDIAIMAVTSSIGEEILFRGAMQHAWGFWMTVAVFTVVHGFFQARYATWMVFAGVVGVAFGLMMDWAGTILAPTLAHFTINYFNLHRLNQRAIEGAE